MDGVLKRFLNFCVCWVRGLQLLSSCLLVAQSCQTRWDPMDCSPPGSSAHTGAACQFLLRGGGSSQPGDWTHISCIAGRFLTSWATREAQVAHVRENLPTSAGEVREEGSIPGWGRSHEGGNGSPPQYSCLEDFMDRGPWWATVHGVSKSQTRLRDLTQATKTPYAMHSLAKKKVGG